MELQQNCVISKAVRVHFGHQSCDQTNHHRVHRILHPQTSAYFHRRCCLHIQMRYTDEISHNRTTCSSARSATMCRPNGMHSRTSTTPGRMDRRHCPFQRSFRRAVLVRRQPAIGASRATAETRDKSAGSKRLEARSLLSTRLVYNIRVE